jgi:predicted transcriptional regulator
MLDLEDRRPLRLLKEDVSAFIADIRKSGRPVVLTEGDSEVVVQDATAYQGLLDHIDELEAIAGIERGLADRDAGRGQSLQEFEQEFRAKHGIPGRTD